MTTYLIQERKERINLQLYLINTFWPLICCVVVLPTY